MAQLVARTAGGREVVSSNLATPTKHERHTRSMKRKTPMHIIFAGGFVFQQGKLLLGKRSMHEGHLPGYWAVPGGKVEYHNETLWNIVQKTVKEEVREETDVIVSIETMQLINTTNFLRTDGKPVVAMNFLCDYISGEAKPLDGTDEVRWVTLEETKDLLIETNVRKQISLAFEINAKARQ